MSTLLPDSPKEIVGSIVATVLAIAGWRGKQTGVLSRLWSGFISFLAAPVERSLAQREAHAYKRDNDRKDEEISRKDEEIDRLSHEITRLRERLSNESSDGSSRNEDGKTPTLPSISIGIDD